MKTLVATLCSGEEFQKIAEITHPQMLAYARKIGAKFCNLGVSSWPSHISPQWQKFGLWNLFNQFDRIIFFDTDVLINVDAAPNLFEVVPEHCIGAYPEGLVCDRYGTLAMSLRDNNILHDHLVYDGNYFNTGVMVLSKVHQDLFIWPEAFKDNFYEQSLINARAFAYGFPLYGLEYRFNRMSVMDELTGEDRWSCPIVHYAGSTDRPAMREDMRDVLERWKRKETPTTRIAVECTGGLGDVVYAEPVIRYMIEHVYKDVPGVEFYIITNYQRLFDHFNYDHVTVTNHMVFERMEATCVLQTHPHAHDKMRILFPYEAVHNIDFAVACMLRCSMANEFKSVRLAVHEEELKKIDELHPKCPATGTAKRSRDILIHAGTGWASKTFPADYWQEIIDGLDAAHLRCVLIGKHISDDHAYVPIKCPENGLDLRDKLSIGELIALISVTPRLLTNESSPLCIAGAFDNEIYLIANPKRPEYVLPFRMGSPWYKATAFMGPKLCCEHIGRRPNNPDNLTIGNVNGNIRDYLPDPEEVIEGIKYAAFR